jgi:hypothetical protein
MLAGHNRAVRGVRDGVLVSEQLPALRLRVVPALRYVGSFTFDLRDIARVERHLFVEASGSTVARMLVVHFESFLPGVNDLYRYALTNTRELGGELYGRSAGTLSLREELAESPDAEMAHTASFLEGHGLALPDRQAVARFARVIGEDRHSELLIFYHEIDGAENGILERAERAFEFTMER